MPQKTTIGGVEVGVAGALTLIERKTLSVAGTLEFASIPQTYADLVLKLHLRATAAVGATNALLRCNSDTNNNYRYSYLYQAAGTVIAGAQINQTSHIVGRLIGSSANGNNFSDISVEIQQYRGSSHKGIRSEFSSVPSGVVSSDCEHGSFGGLWHVTSAITALSILPGSGTDFEPGTVATLFGVN